MKNLFGIITCIFLFSASPVFAFSLEEAKNSGYVGEKQDGFLGVIKTDAKGEIASLVAEINAKRKAMYKKLAKKTGTDLQAVGKVTANKVIGKMLSGQYYMNGSGSWVKK